MKCPVTEGHELACETTLKIFSVELNKRLDDFAALRYNLYCKRHYLTADAVRCYYHHGGDRVFFY